MYSFVVWDASAFPIITSEHHGEQKTVCTTNTTSLEFFLLSLSPPPPLHPMLFNELLLKHEYYNPNYTFLLSYQYCYPCSLLLHIRLLWEIYLSSCFKFEANLNKWKIRQKFQQINDRENSVLFPTLSSTVFNRKRVPGMKQPWPPARSRASVQKGRLCSAPPRPAPCPPALCRVPLRVPLLRFKWRFNQHPASRRDGGRSGFY